MHILCRWMYSKSEIRNLATKRTKSAPSVHLKTSVRSTTLLQARTAKFCTNPLTVKIKRNMPAHKQEDFGSEPHLKVRHGCICL